MGKTARRSSRGRGPWLYVCREKPEPGFAKRRLYGQIGELLEGMHDQRMVGRLAQFQANLDTRIERSFATGIAFRRRHECSITGASPVVQAQDILLRTGEFRLHVGNTDLDAHNGQKVLWPRVWRHSGQ